MLARTRDRAGRRHVRLHPDRRRAHDRPDWAALSKLKGPGKPCRCVPNECRLPKCTLTPDSLMPTYAAKRRPHDEARLPRGVRDRSAASCSSLEERQDPLLPDQRNLGGRAPRLRRGRKRERNVPRLEGIADGEGHQWDAVPAPSPDPEDGRAALSERPGVAPPGMGRGRKGAGGPPPSVLSDPRGPPGRDARGPAVDRGATLRDRAAAWPRRAPPRDPDAGRHGPRARVGRLRRALPGRPPPCVLVSRDEKPGHRRQHRSHRGLRGSTSVGLAENAARGWECASYLVAPVIREARTGLS